jgi:hypothetical protein
MSPGYKMSSPNRPFNLNRLFFIKYPPCSEASIWVRANGFGPEPQRPGAEGKIRTGAQEIVMQNLLDPARQCRHGLK